MILNGNACEIVINHLVIDYVSWQILLQDLHYLLSGSEIQELPYEMASYGEFASDLMTQLGTGLFERQRTGTDTLRKMYSYEREGIIQRTWKRAENNGESLHNGFTSSWLKALANISVWRNWKLSLKIPDENKWTLGIGILWGGLHLFPMCCIETVTFLTFRNQGRSCL